MAPLAHGDGPFDKDNSARANPPAHRENEVAHNRELHVSLKIQITAMGRRYVQ